MTIPQQQRDRRDLSTVDEELLRNKENKRVFRKAAYSMGLGVGFLLIQPLLPEIDDKAKADAMMHIFRVVSFSMILYSVSLGFAFFFLRAHIKLVLFLLSWIVMPMVGLWCVTEGYKVLTQ